MIQRRRIPRDWRRDHFNENRTSFALSQRRNFIRLSAADDATEQLWYAQIAFIYRSETESTSTPRGARSVSATDVVRPSAGFLGGAPMERSVTDVYVPAFAAL